MALMSALAASKDELPPDIRELLEGQEAVDHRQTTKQLHKLVSQQSQAKKELHEVRRARSQFVSEWTSYLHKLTKLLEEQMGKKNTALAKLAETEERWLQQLHTSSKEIKKQSGAGLAAVEISSDDDAEDMDMQDHMVAEAAAQEAQRAAVIETSQQQEAALVEAMRLATAAAAAHEEEFRERTPRRRNSGKPDEAAEDKATPMQASKGAASDKPIKAEAKPPPQGAR